MDDALVDVVLGRVDGDGTLAEAARDLVLAACRGDDALAAALAGGRAAPAAAAGDRADGSSGVPGSPGAPGAGAPVGAYLRSITVAGFRGVGPEATLELEPGAGLTVVVGRNGSGKSSFADALEVLLTGTTDRFEKQTVFRDGWRNLHRPTGARVAADFHVAGAAGTTTVERRWDDDAGLADGEVSVQVAGERRAPGLDRLGWADALVSHRPFLAHSELAAVLSTSPTRLYDRLASVLGLDELVGAQDRLGRERRSREAEAKDVDAERKRLAAALGALDRDAGEERAAAVARALSTRQPDLDAVEQVVTGATGPAPGGSLDTLRQLAALDAPPVPVLVAAAERLRAAAAGLDAVAGTSAARARALADLLDRALDHHAAHPDEADCPVCGRSGALDAAWEGQAAGEVGRLRAESDEADRAHKEAGAARADAIGALRPVPAALIAASRPASPAREALAGSAAVPGDDLATGELVEAWAAWASPPATDRAVAADLRRLADHVVSGAGLAALVGPVHKAAAEALAARDDRWAPVAAQVAAWVVRARAVEADKPLVKDLKAAATWLRAAHDDIRNDRLRPIAEQAQEVWHLLRHESNVSLGVMRLTGSATQRRVELAAQVDGSDGNALGVMSQGEVNALALSIFLPRAMLPESPFRFVVIDDPVQAMDPAKVDGLARALDRAARARQVVVFTHDDRLPAAVRRLGIAARVVQVQRRRDSVVEVVPAADPAAQALRDARVVAKSLRTPLEVRRRVVPGLCRLALEATLTSMAQRALLDAGARHDEVEETLASAQRLTTKAALALFGTADEADKVMRALNEVDRVHGDTFKKLQQGAHGVCPGDPLDLVADTSALVTALGSR
ncbi:MAG TPA: AAA family ATPase [Acidimicrobiales bacterium]|nr:AAA family ATPase [Acidimicrobiales bacterium]